MKITQRLNHDRVVTLNCGLGRDSITMLCLLAERRLSVEGTHVGPEEVDAVLFSDTGNEWPHTYALAARVAQLCERVGVPFHVVAKGTEFHLRPALMDDFRSRQTVASLGKADCTENHKILPLRRFINGLARDRFGVSSGREWGALVRKGTRRPHLTLIGIAADETSRLREHGRSPQYMSEAYPLVEAGLAKRDEADILARWGFADVRKSGCYCCPYQPAGWWWALSVTEPDIYARVVEYEAHAMARNPRMAATGFKAAGKPMRIPEVVSSWRARNPDASTDAVLDKQYTRCTKDARAEQRSEEKLIQLVNKAAS